MRKKKDDKIFKTVNESGLLGSIDLKSAYFVLFVLFLYHVLSMKKASNIYFYIFAFSLFTLVSLTFKAEIKNNFFRNVLFYLNAVFSLQSIAIYFFLITEFSYVGASFLLIVLFVMMFIFEGKYYWLSMGSGAFVGAFLYIVDSNDCFFQNVSYEKLEVACVSAVLSVLFRKIFFIGLEKKMVAQEDNFKTLSCAINHEIGTSLSSLRITLSSIEEKIGIHGKEVDIISCIRRCEKVIQNITIMSEVMHMNFQDYLPKTHWESFDILDEVNKIVQEYPFDTKMMGKIKINGDRFVILNNKNVFRNIVFNLIKNAIFFIKKAGKGDIEIILVKSKDENNMMLFRDTGYGVRPEFVNHIFEKFFSRRKTGTGFGLFFCKKAMLHFGGDIVCSSKLGDFTEFRLFFPKIEGDKNDRESTIPIL